ncbi:MAG: acyl-ACP--UDP-N-acetylglucosamine O-acyltransferase [Verrucomicrobiota bacterium]|nr:acyl-ACP--UDP-N-acetylglucosamine O-acyltransferase [Verrucomicrobiota bacterium]
MRIHPSAIVDPAAQLGREVEIGPGAVIGGEVVIGDHTVVQAHTVIEGAVRIGRENLIGYGAIVGAQPQDLSFKRETRSSVTIGDRNVIREYCTIHRGTAEGSATTIGDGNFLMVGVHLGHNCRLGNGVIIANNSLLAGYVQIDDGAFVAGGARFHQFIHIGRLALAEGRYSKNLPPFLSAAREAVFGINVVGMRRAGLSSAERDEIKRAFKLLYRSGLNIKQALAAAAEAEFGPIGREFFEFVAKAGKRGIVAYGARFEAED